MQKRLKLSLFSVCLMSLILGGAFAVNNIIESWRIQNTAISVTGRLLVQNLDDTAATTHAWGEFRTTEVKSWVVSVQNVGDDIVKVAWRSFGLSTAWIIKGYYSFNVSMITNVYPESPDPFSSVFTVPLEAGNEFYVEFDLQKVNAGDNANFQIEIMSVAV